MSLMINVLNLNEILDKQPNFKRIAMLSLHISSALNNYFVYGQHKERQKMAPLFTNGFIRNEPAKIWHNSSIKYNAM